jgi:Holliday junction resolvase RusA-like endonuclease
MYTPTTANVFRTMAGMAAWEAFEDGELPIQTGVHICTAFFLRRPKRLKGEAVLHCSKPDLDNLDKSLRDGLQQAGIFSDDCIIHSSASVKYYANEGESPRAEVEIKFDPEDD